MNSGQERAVQLDLSSEERKVLEQALTSYLSDLSYEIGNTDNFDYRGDLKDRATVLKKILSALQASGG